MSKTYSSSSSSQPQYASSRRAKLEQKKLTNQVVFFLLLAVGIVLLFLFVILPTLIRVLASLSGTPTESTNDVPVQVPFLSAPVSATSSADLKLTGFSQKGYTIAFVGNGQPLSEASANEDGSFEVEITLTPGENKIAAYAIDADKKESPISHEYTVVYDNEPPSLEILEPQDKQVIQGKSNQNLTVQGKTDLSTKLHLNGRLVFTKDDGSFSIVQPLSEGDNTLSIKATDQAGNITEKVLVVTFHQ